MEPSKHEPIEANQEEYERIFGINKQKRKRWRYIIGVFFIILIGFLLINKLTSSTTTFSIQENIAIDSIQDYFLPLSAFNTVSLKMAASEFFTSEKQLIYRKEGQYFTVYNTTYLNNAIGSIDIDKYTFENNEVLSLENTHRNAFSNEKEITTFSPPRIILKVPPKDGIIEWIDSYSQNKSKAANIVSENNEESINEFKINCKAEWDSIAINGNNIKSIRVTKKSIQNGKYQQTSREYYLYGIGLGRTEFYDSTKNDFTIFYQFNKKFWDQSNE